MCDHCPGVAEVEPHQLFHFVSLSELHTGSFPRASLIPVAFKKKDKNKNGKTIIEVVSIISRTLEVTHHAMLL